MLVIVVPDSIYVFLSDLPVRSMHVFMMYDIWTHLRPTTTTTTTAPTVRADLLEDLVAVRGAERPQVRGARRAYRSGNQGGPDAHTGRPAGGAGARA